MIHKVSQQGRRTKEKAQGGNGILQFRDLFTAEDLGDRASMMAVITLQPGDSVGIHAHTENGELYYVMDGTVDVTEDGAVTKLEAGDAEFCADGHTHGMENTSKAPAQVLAVIVPNR